MEIGFERLRRLVKPLLRHPLIVSIVSAVVGAIAGSALTVQFPLVPVEIFTPPEKAESTTVLRTDATPQELLSWYRSFDNDAQAQVLAEAMYYGRRVRWSGRVRRLTSHGQEGYLWFDNWSARCPRSSLLHISKGATVIVEAELTHIGRSLVQTWKCELIEE